MSQVQLALYRSERVVPTLFRRFFTQVAKMLCIGRRFTPVI